MFCYFFFVSETCESNSAKRNSLEYHLYAVVKKSIFSGIRYHPTNIRRKIDFNELKTLFELRMQFETEK